MRRLLGFAAALVLLSLFTGCRTEPTRAPSVGVEPLEKERPPAPAEIPPHRKPAIAGDVLVYPCQWRRADEVAAELYNLLFPKYGPWMSIVPDYANNVVLVYVPPKASRWDAGSAEAAPGTPRPGTQGTPGQSGSSGGGSY